MGDIYKSAAATMIWLGPEDQSTAEIRVCIVAFKKEEQRYRQLGKFIAETKPELLSKVYREGFCALLDRPWFSRGWVIQEYLLSKSVSFICGSEIFTEQELTEIRSASGKWGNSGRLDDMRESFFIDQEPLGHIDMMRLLSETCGHFDTTEPIDKLYSLLGLWKPTNFAPSYTAEYVEILLDFTRCIGDEAGSLEFLSLSRYCQRWSFVANGLPSWVPNWTVAVAQDPQSIALGGKLTEKKTWGASKGREALPSKPEKGPIRRKRQLLVRGGIVDLVDQVFDREFREPAHYEMETMFSYLERFVSELSSALSPLSHWTILDLLKELSTCDAGGSEPDTTPEEILDSIIEEEDYYCLGLMSCRKVIVTENGDVGLAPSWCEKRNRIVIFHGCSVPIIVSEREDGTFTIIGDCFINRIMHGEAVYWEESEAEEFVLV